MSGKRTDALFNEAQALLQAQIGANRRATTTMPTDPTPAMCTDKCQSYGGILAGMMAQSYNQYQALDAWLNNGGPTPYTPIKNALERTIEEADLACARDTDGTLCGTKLFQQKAALQALPCHVPTAVSLDSSHGTCNATCSAGQSSRWRRAAPARLTPAPICRPGSTEVVARVLCAGGRLPVRGESDVAGTGVRLFAQRM